jgi:bifunctional UDP-N-acetylglucosamine pyrophosphorylase/glucosamine-1-phosphate N-acetyltransferase
MAASCATRRQHGQRIVEEKDATAEEKAIREVNTGIMAIPSARLADWLGKLKNDNAQGEYYLTDIVALAVAEGLPVRTAQPDGEWEVLGVNSKVQLAELERVHQRNLADQPCWSVACVWPIRRASMCVAKLSHGRDVSSMSAAFSRVRSNWAMLSRSALTAC